MKVGLLSGIALAISAVSSTSAQAVQECGQIVEELNVLSATISRDAKVYWVQRDIYMAQKTAMAQKTSSARASAASARAAQLAASAQSQATAAKSAMPDLLVNFSALAGAAQSQKCLPADKLRALRDEAFQQARRVNFDRLPAESSLEAAPAAKQPPRMPTR